MLFNRIREKLTGPKKTRTNTKKVSSRTKHAQDKNQRVEKIPVDQLRIGMFVRELDIPWEESTFLFQGMEITTQEEILEVQQQCEYVWVDYTEFKLSSRKKPEPVSTPRGIPDPLLDVEEEYDEALEVHNKTKEMVIQLFDDLRLGLELDATSVKDSISGSVDSILRNPDASIWLTRLQEANNATAQHSLNVTALSLILGRAMGFSKEELENLGMSAMMHDIGKAKLPQELLNKEEPLNQEETALYETHPQLGYEILSQASGVYHGAANVALYHHKFINGTGFPNNLDIDKMPLFAKIVSIANTYDHDTTQTLSFAAMSPTDCLNKLYKSSSTLYDRDLILRFIDGMGIFPSGSIVEMTNNEVGIVLSSTRDKLKPRVIMMLDSDKEAAIQQVIDLSMVSLDAEGNPYQIKTTHPDGAFGLIVEEFQQAGLRIG